MYGSLEVCTCVPQGSGAWWGEPGCGMGRDSGTQKSPAVPLGCMSLDGWWEGKGWVKGENGARWRKAIGWVHSVVPGRGGYRDMAVLPAVHQRGEGFRSLLLWLLHDSVCALPWAVVTKHGLLSSGCICAASLSPIENSMKVAFCVLPVGLLILF